MYPQDPDSVTFRLARELGWGESDMKNTAALKQFLTEVPQDKEDSPKLFTSLVFCGIEAFSSNHR